MQRKDIEIPVLLLLCIVISKLVISILAIIYIFFIKNSIIQNSTNIIIRIEIKSEIKLY